MRRRLRWAVAFALAFGLVALLAVYRQRVATGEGGTFALDYPARAAAASGTGAATAPPVVVNVDHMGVLKRLLQPNVVNLKSHAVRNVGDKPLRIRFVTEGFSFPTHWESTEKSFDERTHVIARPLPPHSQVSIDWYITLPEQRGDKALIMDGKIVVLDASTNERLSEIPVRIVQGVGAAAAAGGDCCAPAR